MQTSSAPMHTNKTVDRKWQNANSAFTLTELIVVLVIISLFVMLAQMNLFGLLRKSTFKAQAEQLVSTMQMAATAAAESEKRYEVIINLAEQKYTLCEITSAELSEVLEEEIIAETNLSGSCRIAYVLFDDFTQSDRNTVKVFFRTSSSGWQAGGKIVLLDESDKPYSVVVNRISRIVRLQKTDVEILMPKNEDEMLF